MDPVVIFGGLTSTIGALVTTIIWLAKYVLADKDRQIAQLTADRDEWKTTALSALHAAETLAEPVAKQSRQIPERRRG